MITSRQSIKVLLVGAEGSGKSSILDREMNNEFHENRHPTIGADFCPKDIEVDGQPYKMEIWDTAGQERYHSLVSSYTRAVSICFFVVDLNNAESLSHSQVDHFRDIARRLPDSCIVCLVANKSDLPAQITDHDLDILRTDLQGILKQNEAPRLYKCSAKTGEGIKKTEKTPGLFEQAIRDFARKHTPELGMRYDDNQLLIEKLKNYKTTRERNTTWWASKDPEKDYLSPFGRFFGYSKHEKFHAVDALIKQLEGNPNDGLTKTDFNALHQGELGKIITAAEKDSPRIKNMIKLMCNKASKTKKP